MERFWDNVWYNGDIKYLVISKVYIEYMDGTKTTLTGSALTNCIVWTQPGYRWS